MAVLSPSLRGAAVYTASDVMSRAE